MGEVVAGRGVGKVEVVARGDDVCDGNGPGVIGSDTVSTFGASPPDTAVSELLIPHGLGLAVALATFRRVDLIEPSLLCRAGLIKEQQVHRDLGIGGEDA